MNKAENKEKQFLMCLQRKKKQSSNQQEPTDE